ncbi:MAG: transglutaminase-like cysteine peptidase [Gammaproteobacteria bacterium]|nr:MAG: transglutaminase-like cysteine peptidase [Gammaproteobacteria bacterium]
MSQFRRGAARVLLLLAFCPMVAAAFPANLFGYRQAAQENLADFPQWLNALERQLRDNLRDGDCDERRLNRCHMRRWLAFLDRIRALPVAEQLREVNRYANEKDYILDLENYGIEDYWAIPREFFANGGDCEDFAITKYFSLRWLGYPQDEMRIVVVQDTNLAVPHAVLAVGSGADILVLDNQVPGVLGHRQVVHYAPVYSINERGWWIHTPGNRGSRS